MKYCMLQTGYLFNDKTHVSLVSASVNLCVSLARSYGSPRSSCWMRRRPPLTWRQIASSRTRYGRSLVTAPCSLWLIGSTPSWIMTGNTLMIFRKFQSHLLQKELIHTYLTNSNYKLVMYAHDLYAL